MKTTLAPTVTLATPKVEKFTKKLCAALGMGSKVIGFYTCEPDKLDVEDREGNRWKEGSWGVDIITHSFETDFLPDLDNLSNTINVESVCIKPHDEKMIKLSIWLTAKVMR